MNWALREIKDIKQLVLYIERILPKSKRGVSVVVTTNRPIRSNKQNRYYRGVIVAIIGEGLGYKKCNYWMVHEALKDMFCPEKETALGMIKSTRLLNTVEEEVYHKDIRDWYEEDYDVIIPLPNETQNWDYLDVKIEK